MKRQKLFPWVVVVAGLLAYSNSFTGSYFHDDFPTILENPTIRQFSTVLASFRGSDATVAGRPLINVSLAVNYAISGYNVWSYHVVNLVVHILAGLTLFGLVRRTLLQPALRERFGAVSHELALATAVLWTVHPLQTESVTYIVQRAESIMGLFYLLTLYGFIRGVESPRPRLWYGLSVTACALGMASKQVMVSAPLTVMLYDRAFFSGSFRHAWRQRRPVYLALSATWAVLIVTMVYSDFYASVSKVNEAHHLTRWSYLLTQSAVIVSYLRWSVWPHPLPLLDVTFRPGNVILPGTAIRLLLGGWAWALRKNSVWGFVGAWFFLILAPTSSFLPTIDPFYLHRMYLPLAMVVSVAVMGLYTVAGRPSFTVFAVVAIGLGFLTWRQNQAYQKNSHFSLGLAYGKAGRTEEAIRQYEQALQITPNDPLIHYNLGVAFMQLSRPHEAMEHYEQALRLKPDMEAALERLEQALRFAPDDAEAHYSLGVALEKAGKVEDAIRHYEQALRTRPDYAEAHNGLGRVLLNAGNDQDAILHFEQALRIRPDDAEAHNDLGGALWNTGNAQDAMVHFEEALRLKPDSADVHFNFGVVLLQQGKLAEAVTQLEQAVQLNPADAEAHYSLAVGLEKAGRVPEAVSHYEQALQIKPDFADAQKALARLRAVQ